MTLIMRISATQTFNWPLNIVRIGQNISYHFSADVNLINVNNGPRNIDSEINAIPTRLRPNVKTATPYIYLTGGLVWVVGKIIVNSGNGSVSLSPLNGQFATNDTFYNQKQSMTVFI